MVERRSEAILFESFIKGKNKGYRVKDRENRKRRRIWDESGMKMSMWMLLEHQGTSPPSSTAERSIRAQHSKTRAGETQPGWDDGKT